MRLLHSADTAPTPVDSATAGALQTVSAGWLRECVAALAYPRHALAQTQANRRAAGWISQQLTSFGYRPASQGVSANVVALAPGLAAAAERPAPVPCILVGAHYDTVPTTPGADDNASAIAALLACARAISATAPERPVCFVAFNREEDAMAGSAEFVASHLPGSRLQIQQAHVLEMVGYCSHAPGSQRRPAGLPLPLPDTGDFLGVIGNQDSNALIEPLLARSAAYLPGLPVSGLQVHFGLERLISDLLRSDHAPFWRRRLPALMWTDTAEFRNPHYHRPSDTPDTLDYDFLERVTRLLLLQCLLG